MQYLNDQHGNAVGVFISLPEWEAIQKRLEADPEREAWLAKCVGRGLEEMEAGHFASPERISDIFKRMGAHAD